MPEQGAELHTRLNKAAAGRSYRHISDLTGIHAETVRRYMQGQAPSAEFLSRFCEALELNADWLLIGRGPMGATFLPTASTGNDTTGESVHSIAASLERVTQRLERLEETIGQLESKLRGACAFMLSGDDHKQVTHAQSMIEPKPPASAPLDHRADPAERGQVERGQIESGQDS